MRPLQAARPRLILFSAWILGSLLALAGASGCASLKAVRVEEARTGETVVRVSSPRTFDEIAEQVYGEAIWGPTLANLSRLPYDRPVPRGTLLVLPPRSELEARAERTREAERRFRDGVAAADRGEWRQAASRFRAALERDPGRLDVRYNLGLALMRTGELADATALLEEVARRRPDHADSRYALGAVLRRRRAFDRARREFEAALHADPAHRNALEALARTWEDLGEPRRARRAWAELLSRHPDDPGAGDVRARLRALDADESRRGPRPPGAG